MFILLLTSNFLFAQLKLTDLRNQITLEEFLSNRPANNILQDNLGFIWFTTDNGLNRYDGRNILEYRSSINSPYLINGSDIKSIHQASEGGVLIIYQSHFDYLDYLKSGAQKANKILLDDTNGIDGEIKNIFIDNKGNIYLLALKDRKYTFLKSNNKYSFEVLFSLDAHIQKNKIIEFIKSQDETFWINRTPYNIQQLSVHGKVLKNLELESLNLSQSTNKTPYQTDIFFEDSKKRIWLSFSKSPGIYKYNIINNSFEIFNQIPTDQYYSDLWEDKNGNVIIGVSKEPWEPWQIEKLYLLDNDDNLYDISDVCRKYKTINVLYSYDYNNILFLGSYQGLIKVVLKDKKIKNYLSQELEDSEWGWSIRGIIEDGQGYIYFAREEENWYHLDIENDKLDTIPFSLSDSIKKDGTLKNSFNLLNDDDGFLWGTRRDSNDNYFLVQYDFISHAFYSIPFPHFIQSICLTQDNLIWIICGTKNTKGALYSFNKKLKKFDQYFDEDGVNPLKNDVPTYILETKDNNFWVGTDDGLVYINKNKSVSQRYKGINEGNQFSNSNIIVIFQNDKGDLFLGTQGGGLNIFNPDTEELTIFDESDGLCNNYICGIIPDEKGNYWLSSFNGISYFNTKTHSFRNFYKSDGLSHNEFNRFSFFKDSKGRYYFGGMNGLNVFFPEDLLNEKPTPGLQLTKFTRFNRNSDSLIVETNGLKDVNEIIISPYDSYFQFDFFLPDYKHPDKIRYRYWLEGYENDWNELGTANSLRFHQLAPNEYDLRIEAAVSGGGWDQNGLKIKLKVKEHPLKSWYAYMIYITLVSGGFYLVYRYRVNRKLDQAETKRLIELDEFKSRFYANITHEFRTPLTLISGPAENAIANFENLNKKVLIEDLKLINRNSKRILYLINRILDISKLEAGKLQPEYTYGDIVQFLKYITESFHSLAQLKKIQLTFYNEIKNPKVNFDQQKLTHILYNLISNAIKYTANGGNVIIHSREQMDHLLIKVKDDGSGISEERLPYIFDRFYSIKSQSSSIQGTGIGLAFTKELVKILDGQITAENNPDSGCTFSILIPINRQVNEEMEKTIELNYPIQFEGQEIFQTSNINKHNWENIFTQSIDKPLILIIEDHSEVAFFIAKCLKPNYNIDIASDGKKGIEKAIQKIPDLIVSDVMMPEKDGLQVCHELKNDMRTSHIPIILLTAKADLEARLDGLSKGADDYLSKPFNENELKIRIENLLDNRRKLQLYYGSHENIASITTTSINSKSELSNEQDTFILKVKEIVEKHITDYDFDVPKLCKAIGMSRTQLHRKIKAITGKPITHFINSIRLSKAKLLLNNPNLSIAEVAYDSGFSDPNYFSRIFNDFFGCNPTEFRNNL